MQDGNTALLRVAMGAQHFDAPNWAEVEGSEAVAQASLPGSVQIYIFMNSGLNSEVLNLFYSIQNGFETILFYSILKRRRELIGNYSGVARIDAWGQCRSVESQSGAQI